MSRPRTYAQRKACERNWAIYVLRGSLPRIIPLLRLVFANDDWKLEQIAQLELRLLEAQHWLDWEKERRKP